MKTLISTLIYLASFAGLSVAGTSVSSQHLTEIIKRSPVKIFSVISKDLKWHETGEGMRLGRHFGTLAGHPVGPYTFNFSYISGKSVNVHSAEITTAWSIKDAKNIDYGTTPPTEFTAPLRIVESITGMNISAVGMPADTAKTSKNESSSEAKPTPTKAEPASGEFYSGTLAQGDRLYAGECFADTFSISLTTGQKVKVVFETKGFIPVLLSKKDGKYSLAAGSVHGKGEGETVELEHTAAGNSRFLATITTKNKGVSGSYKAKFYIDGKQLSTPVQKNQGAADILVK